MLPEPVLRRLLDRLDGAPRLEDGRWEGWEVRRIDGGRNSLLYRAVAPGHDLAIKFAMDDWRDRVGREYNSLAALRRAGLDVAPEPVLLDRTRYSTPLVVQTWLAGDKATVPDGDDGWAGLAQHLAHVHRVTPRTTGVQLPTCTVYARTAEEARERVWDQLAFIPDPARPAGLCALFHRLETAEFPDWPPSPVTLCRLDNNLDNYIRRPGTWASVDWEYSGWGDPAFDVANLVTHVSWIDVPQKRWGSFVDRYCALVDDDTAPVRIRAYCQILVVWWAARLARYLYEIPNGKDRRLVDWPAGWQADIEAKYAHYVALAQQVGGERT
jgi:aminoglycoside phosphotransferase (APT) family kinase protein